jgi:hypothetical protein
MTTAEFHALGWIEGPNRVAMRRSSLPSAPVSTARTLRTYRLFVPMKVRSESNAGGKLRDKLKRKAAVKEAVARVVGPIVGMGRPKRITFVVLNDRELDEDNLGAAVKNVRDSVCHACVGYEGAIGDADRDVKCSYRQRRRFDYEACGCWIKVEW